MTLQTYNWLMIYILGFFCSVLLFSASEKYDKHPMAKWSTNDWAGVIMCSLLSFGFVAAVCLVGLSVWVSKKGKKPFHVLHQFLTKDRRFSLTHSEKPNSEDLK